MELADHNLADARQARARALCWGLGDLSWKFHAGQLKLNDAFEACRRKLFVGDCSRQLGKSTWAAGKCVEKALRKRKAKIIYSTAFLTDLEQFIRPAFEFVLEDCPEELRPVWIAQKSLFRFPNGSTIKLVGLDRKPNGLRGNKIDLIVIDEAGFCVRLKRLYRSVVIPSTTHVPDARIIMISTQPETPDHEFVEFCDEAEANGNYILLTVYENPLLSKEQIDELAEDCGGYDSTEFKREYLCMRVVDSNRALCAEWKRQYAKDSPRDQYFQFYAKVESMDVGVKNHFTVDLFSHYDFKRAVLVIEDEIMMTGPQMRTDLLAHEIEKKEKELWTFKDDKGQPKPLNIYKRIVDNSDPLLAQDMSNIHHLPFICTDKDSLQAMVNLVKIWVKQGRLEVSPRCKQLLGCLEKGVWNKKRDKFDESKVYGHYDAFAALVYLIRYVDRVVQHDNPIPEWFEAENTTKRFMRKEKELSPLGEELSNLLTPRKKHGK